MEAGREHLGAAPRVVRLTLVLGDGEGRAKDAADRLGSCSQGRAGRVHYAARCRGRAGGGWVGGGTRGLRGDLDAPADGVCPLRRVCRTRHLVRPPDAHAHTPTAHAKPTPKPTPTHAQACASTRVRARTRPPHGDAFARIHVYRAARALAAASMSSTSASTRLRSSRKTLTWSTRSRRRARVPTSTSYSLPSTAPTSPARWPRSISRRRSSTDVNGSNASCRPP